MDTAEKENGTGESQIYFIPHMQHNITVLEEVLSAVKTFCLGTLWNHILVCDGGTHHSALSCPCLGRDQYSL